MWLYRADAVGTGEKDRLHIHFCIDYRDVEIFLVGWLVVLRINVDLAIFQPYLDLEAGDNQSLKIQVARPGIEIFLDMHANHLD